MGRLPGSLKTGGRKRGTPNRRTFDLSEDLNSVGLNVAQSLANLLPQLPVEKQADILVDLMSFLYPKRKAIEVLESRQEVDNKIELVIVDPKNGESRSL